MDVPHNFENVQWFAKYWNETVAAHTDFQRVLGRGLDDKAFQQPSTGLAAVLPGQS
jgi:hypothetical protein